MPPEAVAGHDNLVLRTKTLFAGMARGRPPLWTPLVEESQPSGLSGPCTHAQCWLKVSLSLKLRCCAPQLPPAFFSGQTVVQGRKFVKKEVLKVLRMGLPIVENLSGCQDSIFSLPGI